MSLITVSKIQKETSSTNIDVPSTGQFIDLASAAQGDVLYYNGTSYVRLAPGTSGQVLTSGGAGANPSWAAPIIKEVGTWTSTVRFMTTLTNTNYDSTTTMTGNYVRVGKYYSCHLPAFQRTNLGIAVNWLMHSYSLPVTTGSTNFSLRTTSVYNMKGRWNTAEYSTGQIVSQVGTNSDYAETYYQALDGAGGSLFPYANTAGSQMRCVIDFWVD